MRIGFLVLPQAPLTSVLGPLEILQLAESMVRRQGKIHTPSALELVLVSEHPGPHPGVPAVQLQSQTIGDSGNLDWVIVSAAGPIPSEGPCFSQAVMDWLRAQYAQGARLGSICTGAFLLAESGLLNGHIATTHWRYERLFRLRYPGVLLKTERLVTQAGRFMCSGGAHAYLDFALHWVELNYGAYIASEVAKWLVLDRYRESQSLYSRFLPPRRHGDAKVLQVQDWMEVHYAQAVQIETLAAQVHLSERQFKRRFKAATGESPLEYLQKIRIEQARDRLEFSRESVEQIAQTVGYDDAGFFRTLFRRQTSQTPAQYRRHTQARERLSVRPMEPDDAALPMASS